MLVLQKLSLLAGAAIACGACQSVDLLEAENLGQTEQALLLGSALGTVIPARTTCGMANNITPTCVASNASDESHQWKAPWDGTYVFEVRSTNFWNVLVIAPFATPFTPIGCAAGGTVSTLSLTLTAGQELHITVDGQGALCGTYSLRITRICPAGCAPPSPCYGWGSCNVNGTCSYPLLCAAGEICMGDVCIPHCFIDPAYPC